MNHKNFRITKPFVASEKNIADLKRLCKIAAQIVAKFGDNYLPIFERAHKELKIAEANVELKRIAVQMAIDRDH